MVRLIIGKKNKEVNKITINPKFTKTIIDLGCGTGKQTYKMAYSNPKNFYVGIDSNFENLKRISRKITKKPEKGGLDNVIFVHANTDELPNELNSIADEVQINFPWGSLLEGIILGSTSTIKNIKKITKENGYLKITLTYNEKYDDSFKIKKNLPNLTQNYLNNNLKPLVSKHGIEFKNIRKLNYEEKNKTTSPWGKKILSNRNREVYYIEAIIVK